MSADSPINPQAIQALRELSPDGDAEFLRELVGIYLEDTPKQIAQLEQALASGDASVATRAAHTMKGSSGNFGAEALMQVAKEAELAAKAGDLAAASKLVPELKRRFEIVAVALKQVVAG
jgi:HPt (histidine-containing phosphotransfer) domain-containing protein